MEESNPNISVIDLLKLTLLFIINGTSRKFQKHPEKRFHHR